MSINTLHKGDDDDNNNNNKQQKTQQEQQQGTTRTNTVWQSDHALLPVKILYNITA